MKRVFLSSPYQVRRASVALAVFFTVPTRSQGDPVFEWITEGRQGKGYSGCADLGHAVCWCLGCRDEKLINRSTDGGTQPWKSQINLNRFYASPLYKQGRLPLQGDIAIVCCDWHLLIWDAVSADGTQVSTWDYGQVDSSGKACGCNRVRKWDYPNLDNRTLHGSMDITTIPREESAWVPDDFAEHDGLDDNPYVEPVPV